MLFSKISIIYRLQLDRRCNIIQLFNTIQLSNLRVLSQRINLATDYSNTFSKELFPPLTKCIRLCAALTIVGSPFICKTAASGSFQQSTFSSTNGMLGSAALWYELTLLYQHLAKVLIGWIPFWDHALCMRYRLPKKSWRHFPFLWSVNESDTSCFLFRFRGCFW